MIWDAITSHANAIAALGQVGGAIAAAVAAWLSYLAVRTAKRVAETAIVAELLKEYASPEMYKAMRYFGDFAHDEQHKQRLKRMRDYYFAKRERNVGPDPTTKEDFEWADRRLDTDTKLSAARRLIHHYFKRIWVLQRNKGISDDHLAVVTEAQFGYGLWRNSVLPMTFALALDQSAEGNPLLESEPWPGELIRSVDRLASREP